MKHKLLKVIGAILALAIVLPTSVALARSGGVAHSNTGQTIEGQPLQQSSVTATTRANLNLRLEPNTSSKVLKIVAWKTIVPVLGRDSASQWLFVESGNKRGWIAGWRTTIQGDLNTVPVSEQVGGVICSVYPAGGFLTIWQSDLNLQLQLGCPFSGHPRVTPSAWEVMTAYETFEHGTMIWSDHLGWYGQAAVYVIYANGTYQVFNDTYDPTVDPTNGNNKPPSGLVEPIRGFGKVWREQPGVRQSLGWATASETGGVGRFQIFMANGVNETSDMIWISQTNKTYLFPWKPQKVKIFDIPF